ncbi:MAG: 50S ribosomal protein L11 methyltransferase [Planctomycetota bacterium]|jgi:hypothetical protein
MSFHLRLRGSEAALSVAMDRIHVHCEVLALLQESGSVSIALRDPLPELGLEGVQVEILEELPGPEVTGLEEDAPILLADDLMVRPPWVPALADFAGIDLVVPRGMAFGSGEHASTQAALLLMHRLWPGAGMSFADVGCGSGILAAYASLRGADPVMACDLDPACVGATRELLPRAKVIEGGPRAMPAGCADLVIANMNLQELTAHLEAICALGSGRGWIILSGIQVEEESTFRNILPAAPGMRLQREDFLAFALGTSP